MPAGSGEATSTVLAGTERIQHSTTPCPEDVSRAITAVQPSR